MPSPGADVRQQGRLWTLRLFPASIRGTWAAMGLLRMAVAGLIALHALAYSPQPHHPAPWLTLPASIAIGVVAAFAGATQFRRRSSREVTLWCLTVDLIASVLLLYLWAFDPRRYLFALVVPVGAEATLLLGLRRGLAAWTGVSAAYVGAEFVTSAVFHISSDPAGILVRVVSGLFVVLVTGTLVARIAGERMWFLALLESSPSAMVVTNEQGEIELVNEATERLFGYGRTELLGDPVHVLVPESARARHERLIESYIRDPQPRPMGIGMSMVARRKDGSLLPVEISLTAVMDDKLHVVVTVSDITERRRAEAETVARQVAEQANRAKDEFLSRMSHELRTPLNAVLGFAQILQMQELDPKDLESVRQIRKGGEHLLALIDEVLDISRITAGNLTLSLEPVWVSEALHDAVDLTRPLAAERGIALTLNDPNGLFVLAERQRLMQILLNLLSNAIKYNREAGSVDVSWAETPAGRLRIHVSDTGPGIPPEMLERVFVSFDRLGVEASGVEGTGLGLSLSKALAEAMGGTLEVECEVGAGSVFTVELAIVEPPVERREPERREPERGGHERTVLYIEDNLSNLRLVERILERLPRVRLLSAAKGRLGIDLARREQPDLILLDLHLPDIDGDEVLRLLREDPATSGIPVVVVSADVTSVQFKAMLAAGARDYVTKPLDVQRFLEVLDGLLPKSEDG